MFWVIIVVIAYIPIFYRIHKRLNNLEKEIEILKRKDDMN